MINNRQAGRRRGRGGQQQQRSQGGNPGRGQDNGNRIDSRARGNAAQLHEKYKTLARDSQMQGDRVTTEYYLQFADHYFRVLAETRSRFEENRRQNGGAAYEEDEQEYDDDGEPIVRQEPRPAQGDIRQNAQNGQGGQQGSGQNGQGQYDDDRPRRSHGGNGNAVANSYADGGQDRHARGDRNAVDRNAIDRGGAGIGNDRGNHAAEREQEEHRPPLPTPAMTPPAEFSAEPEQPRRRGRPRREAPPAQEEAAPTFEADRLPPSLGISATTEAAEEKPRRRRARPPAGETTPLG